MHCIAFSASIAQNSVLQVDAIQDDVFTISSGRFLTQGNYSAYWAFGNSANLERARIAMPSFNPIAYPWLRNVNRPAVGIPQPNVTDYVRQPLRLPAKEYLAAQALQSGAGAEQVTIVLGVGTALQANVPGDIFTIRGSSTTAATANAWSSITTTWENDLEGGMYQVVGMRHVSTNAHAARLISQYQVERPGTISVRANSWRQDPLFSPGVLGKYVDFESDSFPTIQVLCGAADAAHEVFLSVVKLR